MNNVIAVVSDTDTFWW